MAVAELAHHALRCALQSLELVRCQLLYDVRRLAREAPLESLLGRVESLCTRGAVLEAIQELEAEVARDPAESPSSDGSA